MKNWQKFIGLSALVYALSSSAQILAQTPVPPPSEQVTADCAKPVYASDQLVCGDSELRQLDARLSQTLAQPRVVPIGPFQESDAQWFKRRSRCAFEAEHRRCLIEAYAERISATEAPTLDIPGAKTAICKNFGNIRRVSIGKTAGNQVFIKGEGAQLLALAVPKSNGSIWQPNISYTQNGGVYNFKTHDGTGFSCKLK